MPILEAAEKAKVEPVLLQAMERILEGGGGGGRGRGEGEKGERELESALVLHQSLTWDTAVHLRWSSVSYACCSHRVGPLRYQTPTERDGQTEEPSPERAKMASPPQ